MSIVPRIVVLDGYALNPGDLSWSALEQLGACVIHPRIDAAEIVACARNASALLTNKTPLSAATLEWLPDLRYIGVLATGYNIVDVAAARARGIPVANIPAYGTLSVSQQTFALLLELTQRTGLHAQSVSEGEWTKNDDWCYWKTPLIELAGLTLGIIGDGRIGRATARIGEAFGMIVIQATRAGGRTELERVLRAADVVSLHCPLTDSTHHLINATTLGWMKPTAYLLNTSRGMLIDEVALAEALNSGQLAGAGLDVLSSEPPPAKHPLLTARNCVITPHIAWATRAARARLLNTAIDNLHAFFAGRPQNVVN
ncbi:D-2-hydroxyacid dehydrogenase [Termitidicoccus mucosus]|uniref:Glycerate dehydrogenase n=1 Tax=Termitidicoccus mucosus TaxID=1184151 RepID=A0A178IQH2_9BACT|nr:glycerate dehydrogenase [Opitutaceae bacterium TSB47]